MINFIVRKILVVSAIVLPLFAGNSCKDDKCGCSGDLQDTAGFALNVSDIIYTDNGTSAVFYQNYYYIYHICNPEAMYENYNQIVESGCPLIQVIGDLYWNCQYVYRQSSSSSSSYYSSYVEYDIFITSMTPILDGK